MVSDVSDGLVGEDFGMLVGLLDRLGVIGPSGCERCVAGLIENRRPAVPAMGQQPETVNEDDRCASAGVGLIDLIGGKTRYGVDHETDLPLREWPKARRQPMLRRRLGRCRRRS